MFLRGFPHCVGGCGSSFSFALQFPLVRVCSRPTFRLAFAPSGVLLGLILSAIAFASGGGLSFPSVLIPPHFLSSTDCSGLPSLVASWNFQRNFIKEGQATFHFSPVYVCVLRLFKLNQSSDTLTKDPLNLVSLNTCSTFNCKFTYLL